MLSDVNEFLSSGGPVLIAILLVSILLWVLIIDRYWFFTKEASTLCEQKQSMWNRLPSHNNWFALKIRGQLISQVQLEFDRYRPLIQLLVVICPLLGLLGTVTGMIQVFDVMAVTGTGNTRAMASGISMATIPTMAGMVVSLIGLYFKTRFDSMAKKKIDLFKDQLLK